ncbi:cyclopropane-fatty-acyl-phospholipid synthase [Murinocardiopsis flavida]|uniref:Cyclopropane-fatty-acyl-phospholipid synthase n=1 Tax=Murinocardiopsis flavida TaxID=645275 RepID=A0A2P8CPP8_9ACTN|nr:cyclopropane-fatty-acyl-phospholipid synthase family protein [Murinocardiopsis flavida]PSK86922.1 cyclopropane-fatty-acyl-phospholipid synthase [Murinocardiopsis flavida]
MTHHAYPRGAAHFLAPLAERFFNGALPVRLRAWDGSEAGPADAPALVLRRPEALRRFLARPGELGLARAYITGDIDVAGDLGDGFRRVRAAVRERGTGRLTAADWAAAARIAVSLRAVGRPPSPPASEARLRGGVNTPGRDADAIAHHYDLSNALYALFMDPSMAYSCAYWTGDGPGYTLADAQADKLALICRKLALTEGTRLLDVGCGWGSLALYAAEHHGARVTAVTLSEQQRDHVRKRIAERGLSHLVEVRRQDYRAIGDAPFDAVASVEMGEHVGARNFPVFASRLHALLRPRGRLLLQQMSRGRGASPGGGPFIESYIAPDMHMRPVGDTIALLEDAGLEVRDVHALREHYVRTVAAWHAEFERRWDDAVRLVGEETARVWRLYFVGGSLAFEEGRMGVDQILAVRPDPGGGSGMAPVRGTGAGEWR